MAKHLNLRLSHNELRELVGLRQALEQVAGQPLTMVAALRRAIAMPASMASDLDFARDGATRTKRVDVLIDDAEWNAFDTLRAQVDQPVAEVVLACVRKACGHLATSEIQIGKTKN